MKIAYSLGKTTIPGGLERILISKANALAELGHEVFLITTCQKGRPAAFLIDSRVQQIDLDINYEAEYSKPRLVRVPKLFLKSLLHKRRLKSLLFKLQLDFFISPLTREAKFALGYDDGSVKVVECHGSRYDWLRMYRPKGLSGWITLAIRKSRLRENYSIVRRADIFVTLTKQDRDLWADLVDAVVIPNFIPFEPSGVASLENRKVIAVGRHVEQKNFSDLIDVWALVANKFPDWILEIYGDGPLKSSLEDKINALGLQNSVKLCPATNQIAERYQEASIYVMTSRYEGFGLVLAEAQATGLPIVSYTCECGPRDIVTDGVDGFLVEAGDKHSFAERLEVLMTDLHIRKRMGEMALLNSKRFSREVIMKEWIELFDRSQKARLS